MECFRLADKGSKAELVLCQEALILGHPGAVKVGGVEALPTMEDTLFRYVPVYTTLA
jgi:hypothetical protein